MEINKLTSRQRQTTFETIEPIFYKIFNESYWTFPEWTLERIPRNVNTKRISLDKCKMSKGWLYESYNTKGIFRCVKCIKNGMKESDATWSSSYTTVLFRAYYEDMWLGGRVQMKIYAQQCKKCGEYMTAEFEKERLNSLAKWLYRWIASHFYNIYFNDHGYQGRRRLAKHRDDLCEACDAGWCYYLKVKNSKRK
ncbi:unnamed protein product [Adineta steineri]|uniref:3CxxC-type domain-containing protein n=1 Tax=Adineta steineri TaxID=433720 RepID=A0A818VWJ0_9BILA|nr:unnamed protein product [Adineta steineri]CAF3716672.1 unnamed protein product [Adineta steineri]